jgi:hypothetical protein
MSEVPGDPGQQPSGQEAINRRAWSKERQLRAAAIGTAVVNLVILGFWLGGKVFGKREAPAGEASPPGTFRATA